MAAAADEFPRGLTLWAEPGLGNQALLTFPAIPGVSWILSDVDAVAVSQDATFSHIINVQAYFMGGAPVLLNTTVSLSQAAAGDLVQTEWTWSGKQGGVMNSQLFVGFNTAVGNVAQSVLATAYPT